MKPFLLATVMVLCGAGLVLAEDLPTKEEVLNRFEKAVGGKDALSTRSEIMVEGTIINDLSWKEPNYTETPFRARSDRDCQVLYAETTDWEDLPHEDSGQPQVKLRWLMHPAFASVIEDFFPDLRVIGREIRNDRPVVVLSPVGHDPTHYNLYFDETTGLLSHIGYYDDLVDWREIHGVMFPRKFVSSRKGGSTTYRFDVVHVSSAPAREPRF
jgi:hypothetical protein